jgi:leucyl aminopeptidase (aminopeptidase T)
MHTIGEEELRLAAEVLVGTALRVTPGERFVAVGDVDSLPMLDAVAAAARNAGAEFAALRLDLLRSFATNHSGERPHKVLPDGVRRAMLSAQASAFVASELHAEASMRDQLLHIVGACKIRHAHMPGITPSTFARGIALDSAVMASVGRELEVKLETAHEIRVTSESGTDLTISPTAARRWVGRFGPVTPGEAMVFPTGSILGSHDEISGVFVADASIGEFFGAREGLLRDPVRFTITHGSVMRVEAGTNAALVRDIEAMLGVAQDSDRVGLTIFGVNEGVGEPTGQVSVDQHRPGMHVVFGDPMGKLTGATWSARTSFAACQARGTVVIDGVTAVDRGKLVR